MGDENHIRTLRDYSKPSHEGYMNTIELSAGNNVVPLQSDTIRLVQNGAHSTDFDELDQSDGGKLRDLNAKESWALLEDLALYDNGSWNYPRDFTKPVKAITFPQDVPSISDRRLIELENQVQRLMEAHLVLTQTLSVNKSLPIQSNLELFVSNFMASQDARLSKFEADFKQQQNEMTNKIDTVLKAITDRIAGALPSDTIKNPKLSTFLILSARSYPTIDLQCSTHVHGSINAVTIHPKQQSHSHDDRTEENEEEEKASPENINVNPSTPPNPSVLFITKKVLKLN
ncbi:hypothetical protein Tco_0600719 [Tanacetum coccineum]